MLLELETPGLCQTRNYLLAPISASRSGSLLNQLANGLRRFGFFEPLAGLSQKNMSPQNGCFLFGFPLNQPRTAYLAPKGHGKEKANLLCPSRNWTNTGNQKVGSGEYPTAGCRSVIHSRSVRFGLRKTPRPPPPRTFRVLVGLRVCVLTGLRCAQGLPKRLGIPRYDHRWTPALGGSPFWGRAGQAGKNEKQPISLFASFFPKWDS